MRLPLGLALLATVGAVVVGVRDPIYVSLAAGSFFALFVNAELAVRLLTARPSHAGAYISHFGIALLFLGIIATARYSETEHVRLVQGLPQQAMGYKLMFVGREQVEKHYTDREKFKYYVALEQDGKQIAVVAPVLYWSDFNKRQSAFLEPGIKWSLTKDIYVSPKGIETEGESPTASISKTTQTPLPFDSSYKIKLLSFDMSNAIAAANAGKTDDLKLGVMIELEHNGSTSTHSIYTTFVGRDGIAGVPTAQKQEPLNIPGTKYYIALQRILPNKEQLSQSQALLAFADASKPNTQPREVFTIELSRKPLINLVWGGVLFMVFGFFISVFRRREELYRVVASANEPARQIAEPVTEQEREPA
jgi:cytochrome c-type biogenesis protein CcmF